MDEMPDVGPGSGRALIERLRTLGLMPSAMGDTDVRSLMEKKAEEVLQIADDLRMASPYQWGNMDGDFAFMSSSSLSGWSNPTAGPHKFTRAKSLGRFSALYADTVLIPDPFENVFLRSKPERVKNEFISTLGVLQVLRPEIEAGIVRFAPYYFPLCKEHKEDIEQIEDEYKSRLEQLRGPLLEELQSELGLSMEKTDNYPYLKIDGASNYLPVDKIDLLIESGALQDDSFPPDGFVPNMLGETFLDPSFLDLLYRHLFARFCEIRYLTDRPIDRDILYLLSENADLQRENLGSQITHALPFIDNLDADTLIKLREEEGEAFRVYRDRITDLVENGPEAPKLFREAFRDLVRPQLNEIDKAVSTARKMAKGDLKRKIVLGTGTATLGLTVSSVSPEFGTLISALGGYQFGNDILSDLQTLIGEPQEVRKHDFFYLWRAQQES